MDLTKIEKPFGLLDDETQAALKAHRGPYEVYIEVNNFNGDSDWVDYKFNLKPENLRKTIVIRAKPQPPRKTVYPWDAFDDRIKWAAVDEFERLWASDVRMVSESSGWLRGNLDIHQILKFQRGDEPWQETLQRRPGYEGDK